jgi:hypothetical protein
VERISIVSFLDALREALMLRFLEATWRFSKSRPTPTGDTIFLSVSYLDLLSAKGWLPGLMAYAVTHFQGNDAILAQLNTDCFRWGRWQGEAGQIHLGAVGVSSEKVPSHHPWVFAIMEALRTVPGCAVKDMRKTFLGKVENWIEERLGEGKVTWKTFVGLTGEEWVDGTHDYESGWSQLRFNNLNPSQIETIQAEIKESQYDERRYATVSLLPATEGQELETLISEEHTSPIGSDNTDPLSHTVLLSPVIPSGNSEHRHLIEQMELTLRRVPLARWPSGGLALSILREEFPWATDALDRIELLMAFWQKMGHGVVRFPPLLLVGEAGCGKTRLAQRLGEYIGLPSTTIAAGGVGAQALLGTERHWANTASSPTVKLIFETNYANPLVIVDEIDKQASDSRTGTLQDALLPLLEPENARRFRDPFLEQACDLSEVNWILIANDVTALTGALRSRLEIVRVGHPRAEHLGAIAQGTRRDLAKRAHCLPDALPWGPDDERWVLNQMQNLFTAREARRWAEQRLMMNVINEKTVLTVVGQGPAGNESSNEAIGAQGAFPKATVVEFPRPDRRPSP